jgi:hypothetical protein
MDLTRGAVLAAVEPLPSPAQEAWSHTTAGSLFAGAAPRAQVVFKKRRLVARASEAPDGSVSPGTTGMAADHGDTRAPRVFTTRRTVEPVVTASDVADTGASLPARRRRRKPAEHSPGEVVRLVMRQEVAATQAPAFGDTAAATASTDDGVPDQGAYSAFEFQWQPLDEHKAVLAALAKVCSILDEAASASRWRL